MKPAMLAIGLVCALPFACQPQTAAVVSGAGLHRAVFRFPQGSIRVNFPSDMAAGDQVIGTIFPEAAGRDSAQQDRNSEELAHYTVDLPGDVRFERNRIFWPVPATLAQGGNTIRLRDRAGHVVAECVLPILPAPADLPGFAPSEGIQLPLGGPAGGLISVAGEFPSAASATIAGRQAALIAQSPRKAVFLTPPEAVGPLVLEVTSGAQSVRGDFRGLALTFSGQNSSLVMPVTVTALARGLSGLKEPTYLVITAAAPGKEGEVVEKVTIRPEDVRPDGTYTLKRSLKGIRGSAYRLNAVLTRTPSAILPLEMLTGEVVARWSRKQKILVTDDARALIERGVVESRQRLDEVLLTQMTYAADPVDLVQSLVQEYCFDLRNRLLPHLPTSIGTVRPLRVPFAGEFVPQGGAPVPAATVIGASAVQSRTFLQFLGDLLQRMTPSGGWGSILVTSQPTLQPFTVDRSSGVTTQTFSATAGPHVVTVGRCRQQVQVVANQTSPVHCVLP